MPERARPRNESRKRHGRGEVEPAALYRRPESQIAGGAGQPQARLRGAPPRALLDRGGGPAEEPAPREGRPDRRHPDPGAQAARAAAAHRRRPFRYRAHAGGAAAAPDQVNSAGETSMEPVSADFEKELAALRDKLEEAEDVRRAITRGEVDAFVVGPGGSGRVLLLANAYQRYRQLVERMQQGAVTATANGHILFANQRFSDMLGVPLAQLYTAPLESYVALGDRARLSAFLMVCARDSAVEVEFARRDEHTSELQSQSN